MKKTIIHLTIVPILLASALVSANEASINWRDYDADNSKTLTLEEFSQLRITQYAALDLDLDGAWSKKEFVKRSDNMKMARKSALRKKFQRWDKDENGELSSEEISKGIKGNFRWLDKNKSGSLSLKEMPKR
ncbi:MAG: hypothetical protein HOH29_10180 [Cellvibrionales bacterium]|jgi:hypothetical protein|nr:hypothetical protein [Cellvibrionales bacterium]